MSAIDHVVEILRATHDGLDLFQTPDELERHGPNGDGAWLAFLQDATNDQLNERGLRLLEVFARQVRSGDYRYTFEDFVTKFELSEGTVT